MRYNYPGVIVITARDVLTACRWALVEIRAIERQRERVRLSPPLGVTSATPYGAHTAPTNNPTAKGLSNLDYLDGVLQAKQSKRVDLLVLAERVLDRVTDARDRVILRGYFLLGATQEATAEELGVSDRLVRERVQHALDGVKGKF